MIDHYDPDIVTAQDYYPFGMVSRVALPGSGKTYKFGFQGQMMDNDVKGLGNQIAFEYRIHDPRVGRFLSVDPIEAKYPGVSPYAFAHNKVNFGNEQEGLEITDGLFKYNQWALNKVGLGDTWIAKLNTSLYNRFSIEGRINQVTTAVKTEIQQAKNAPGKWVTNKLIDGDPLILGSLKRTKETTETVKRIGSGIAHGNTDAIAEGADLAAQTYAGVKSGNSARAAKPNTFNIERPISNEYHGMGFLDDGMGMPKPNRPFQFGKNSTGHLIKHRDVQADYISSANDHDYRAYRLCPQHERPR